MQISTLSIFDFLIVFICASFVNLFKTCPDAASGLQNVPQYISWRDARIELF